MLGRFPRPLGCNVRLSVCQIVIDMRFFGAERGGGGGGGGGGRERKGDSTGSSGNE